ncbi:MAG: ThuA domain-containing protein [Roseibacillus sp.]
MNHAFLSLLFILTIIPLSQAKEFLTSEKIQELLQLERETNREISSPKSVLFCWSKADHPKHTHSYQPFAQRFSSLLSKVGKVQTSAVNGFPSSTQWESADLVVFNLTQSNLSEEQLAAMDNHLAQGGSIMVVHQALVQRVGYEEWAQRIGLAFSWAESSAKSKWGRGELEIKLDKKHEVFRGFPETISVSDELYWNLTKGAQGKISILGETSAPKEKNKSEGVPDATKWPVFWTVEHATKAGQNPGKVFCCVIGHPDEVAFSVSFQIVMMRAFAWCLNEPSQPFLQIIENKTSDQK